MSFIVTAIVGITYVLFNLLLELLQNLKLFIGVVFWIGIMVVTAKEASEN